MYRLTLLTLLFGFVLAGCADYKGVKQGDLIAWKGVAVAELDDHYMFKKIHMVKTLTDSGLEIRDYSNRQGIHTCDKYGLINGYMSTANFALFTKCTSLLVGCDNIFYIRNDKVIKYVPIGLCFTDDSARP